MPTVSDLLMHKQRATVHSIPVSSDCLEAVKKMLQHRIGALVVTGPDHATMGILSERDILRHVASHSVDLAQVSVSEVMTVDVIVCTPEDDLNTIRSIMRSQYVRQIPVVGGDGTLLGIVSIGDVNAHQLTESKIEVKFMKDFIQGRVR